MACLPARFKSLSHLHVTSSLIFLFNILFSSPLILSLSDPVLAPSLGDVGQEVTVVGFGTTNTTTKVQSGKKEQEQR